jgi:hypothetical protein
MASALGSELPRGPDHAGIYLSEDASVVRLAFGSFEEMRLPFYRLLFLRK